MRILLDFLAGGDIINMSFLGILEDRQFCISSSDRHHFVSLPNYDNENFQGGPRRYQTMITISDDVI